MPRSTFWPLRAAVLALTVVLFGCDHVTKHAAEAALAQGGAVNVVQGVLELRYVENHDTAFSLLRTLGLTPVPAVLSTMAMVALIAVVGTWIAMRAQLGTVQHVGFALVLAGALGNVVDRAMRGFVVDFIHVSHWPIFNVADVLVVLGVVAIAVADPRRWKAARTESRIAGS